MTRADAHCGLPPDLLTPRLRLRAAGTDLAAAAAAFFERNRAPHARWNPPPDESHFTVAGQRALLDTAAQGMAGGSLASWWLLDRDAQVQAGECDVLGRVQLTQIARGPFCSAMLGYAIDAAHEGRGLMREALQAVLADAFGRLGLHRVQANVRPENERSLALLARLGFEREGLAREYLFIDGAWRDHVMTALRHPGWRTDQAPPLAPAPRGDQPA